MENQTSKVMSWHTMFVCFLILKGLLILFMAVRLI